MTERKTVHGPGPETKGGGFRGGPKRWTGGGPAPARHIPWPEIFKHHISVCEGHLKMVDMVRKHTVEGTGNYRTIMGCVERTRDMLHEVKQISRSFVPPPNQREQVPLGVSSASMYPGYSPADHEYGKAAEEHGRAAAEARARGEEVKYEDVEFEIGQAKGVKRRTLAGIRAAKAAQEAKGKGSGSGTGSGSDGSIGPTFSKMPVTNGASTTAKVENEEPEGDNPYFVIDTKPTPVDLPDVSNQAKKRTASPPPGPVEGKKHKKQKKKKHDGELPKGEEPDKVEFEDISEEVDARIKEKEEKRKRKEEKKRKRESAGEPAASTATTLEPGDAPLEVEKPKKKKAKHTSDAELPDRTLSSDKRSADVEGEPEDGEGKKKKRKKGKSTSEEI